MHSLRRLSPSCVQPFVSPSKFAGEALLTSRRFSNATSMTTLPCSSYCCPQFSLSHASGKGFALKASATASCPGRLLDISSGLCKLSIGKSLLGGQALSSGFNTGRNFRRAAAVRCSVEMEGSLAKKKCAPCESKGIMPLTPDQATSLLQQVPGWEIRNVDNMMQLHRTWKMKNFKNGLEFFKRVASVAEAEGHHPDLHLVGWNNVSVDLWTHSIGGLHENDFIVAAKINDLDAADLVSRKSTLGQKPPPIAL
eukprot:jgi/Mesen1/1074/ME000123S00245